MNIKKIIVTKETLIDECMRQIDAGACGTVLVCEGEQLIGIITDGDIRRFLLNGGTIKATVENVMNQNPMAVLVDSDIDYMDFMKKNRINILPVISRERKLLDVKTPFEQDNKKKKKLKIPVVIMAGGKGSRLKPYTDILPKPLIPINNITITEHIINHFAEYGCNNIYMVVNYKKEFIKAYFSDENEDGNIKFVDEENFGGTGGGLKLLPDEVLCSTFFMTNCDVLIEADYEKILEQHIKQKNIITMICAKKEIVIPYGTVEIKGNSVVALNEKPKLSYLVNTGMYIIEPKFVNMIPKDAFIHITDIIDQCINNGERVGTYSINDNQWMDMGQLEELQKMKERMEK